MIIFDGDISSSVHVDNKKKGILIIGEGPTNGLDDTTWTTKKNILWIWFGNRRSFVYVCIIMEATVVYLLKVLKLIFSNSKQKF